MTNETRELALGVAQNAAAFGALLYLHTLLIEGRQWLRRAIWAR